MFLFGTIWRPFMTVLNMPCKKTFQQVPKNVVLCTYIQSRPAWYQRPPNAPSGQQYVPSKYSALDYKPSSQASQLQGQSQVPCQPVSLPPVRCSFVFIHSLCVDLCVLLLLQRNWLWRTRVCTCLCLWKMSCLEGICTLTSRWCRLSFVWFQSQLPVLYPQIQQQQQQQYPYPPQQQPYYQGGYQQQLRASH